MRHVLRRGNYWYLCAIVSGYLGQAVKTMADQHFKQALWNWAFVQRRCLTAKAD